MNAMHLMLLMFLLLLACSTARAEWCGLELQAVRALSVLGDL